MKTALDKGQFGPWALVTGASSGIGKELTRQIAASGINVVLVARRDALLAELGRAISQEFDVQYPQATLRLNTMAHLDITHHFGARLAERRRGGLILIGSLGADIGVPFLANDGGAKAYVHSLGEALHYEFKPRGVYVTVVPPPLTNTAVLAKLWVDPRTMPMKPLSVEQCVSEGLNALRDNPARIIPGRMNRIMTALVPPSGQRTMTAKM